MEITRLETTHSTNSWVGDHANELKAPQLVYSYEQTAGRGQRGNAWESAPGMNITATLFFKPENFPASDQFSISEGIALAITDFLKTLGVETTVKWPNDIYAGNRKICGILVEHVVMGHNISRTIAGFGININQTDFKSDAPNPVSVKMLTGKNYDIDKIIPLLAEHLEKVFYRIQDPEYLHEEFKDRLWRKDGEYHLFYDKKKDEQISALISDVEPSGMLLLTTDEGEERKYAFKEVEYLL